MRGRPQSESFVPADPRIDQGDVRPTVSKRVQAARDLLIARAVSNAEKMLALTEDDPNAKPCPLCNRGMPREDRVKLNAIIACLDRAGLGPKATLEITQSPQTEWMEYLDEQELAVLSKMIMIATARMRQDTLSPDGPPALTDGQDEAR